MIHNVTASTFDHLCEGNTNGVPCPHNRTGLAHTQVEKRYLSNWQPDLVITCPAGHEEHLNTRLGPQHEIGAQFSEEYRQRAQQIRALQRHLGLPVK